MQWQYHPQFVRSIKSLESGGVIAYPTEAVWGLGCDPFFPSAIDKILSLKSRPVNKGLILIGGHVSDFDFLLHDVSAQSIAQLHASWPGHNTWLVPHKKRVSELIHGDHDTVAIRVSAHPLVRMMTEVFGGPVVSTSANPSQKPSAKTAVQARLYFRNDNLQYMPGSVGKEERASTIRSLQSGEIIRS